MGLSNNTSQGIFPFILLRAQVIDDSTTRSRPDKLAEFDEIKHVNFINEDGTSEQIGILFFCFRSIILSTEVFDAPLNRGKHSIFYNNLENEIESLKEELKVGEDPDIHFIKSNFNEYYEEDEVLGEGTTATVKKCFKNSTKEAFAAKIIHYRDDTEMLVLVRLFSFLGCLFSQ